MAEPLDVEPIIKKLGHHNHEVRERALDNICNKLKHGIVSDMDLSCNRLLLSKLLHWFNQPVVNKQTECLHLLLQISKHEYGAHTLYQLGAVDFLHALKKNLTSHQQSVTDDILEQIYLSPDCRSQQQENVSYNPVIEHSITSKLESRQSTQFPSSHHYMDHTSQSIPREKRKESVLGVPIWQSDIALKSAGGKGFVFVEFPWICLSSTDIHVMESTNQSLISQDPQLIISACDFLVDVMLYDFPAEIFLQRPLIIKTLNSLLSNVASLSKPTEVGLALVDTLIELTKAIKMRIKFHQDPATFAPKQDLIGTESNPTEESSIRMTSSSDSHCSRPSVIGISDGKDDNATDDDEPSTSTTTDGPVSRSSRRSVSIQITTPNIEEMRLQELQLTVPEFCLMLHKTALLLMERSNFRLCLELHKLLLDLQSILDICLTTDIWYEPSIYGKDLCEKLRLQLHNSARIALKFNQSNHNSNAEEKRLSYIMLALQNIELCKTFVPVDKASELLGPSEKQLMYTLCFDESLAQSISNVKKVAAEYLEVIDTAGYKMYEAAKVVCDSMESYGTFLLDCVTAIKDAESIARMAYLAETAVFSIPYHMNKDLISTYVKFCSDVWPLVEADRASSDYLISVLLKYLAHPISSIRKECYITIIKIIKSCLSFDKPTQNTGVQLKFVLNHSLLWEVACFGLSSDIPEIIKSSQEIFTYIMQCRKLVSNDLWQLICSTLLPIFPLLQGYATPDTTIGKCILAMIDPHFDTNITNLQCMKSAIRVLFTRDTEARTQATKILFSALNDLYSSYVLYPYTDIKNYQGEFTQLEQAIRDMNLEPRSVFSEESLTSVLRVFLAHDVQHTVRLASMDQLCIILQNPSVHKYFLEQNGLELISTLLNDGVKPSKTVHEEELVPGTVIILGYLLQYNPDIRQTLAADLKSLLLLLRCCWLYPSDAKTCSQAAQCLAYIVFDEICPQNTSGSLFTLPKTCCIRYKLPFRVLSYCDISSHRVDVPPGSDPLTQTQPAEMLRIFWNITWHGKLDDLLKSIESGTYTSGSDRLILTAQDNAKLKISCISHMVFDSLKHISNATGHAVVAEQIGHLTAYALISKLAHCPETLSTVTWKSYFARFLQVLPVAPMDKELLLRITGFFVTILNLKMSKITQNLLHQLSHVIREDNHRLLTLVLDSSYSGGDSAIRRPLQNCLLMIMKHIGTIMSPENSPSEKLSGCGDIVRSILKRLTMADASNFYNLASLESSVITLLQLTSRPGWSYGCAEDDSRSLCFQLLKALFEVLSAFHLGRQGNNMSYMGKGVLKSATLCLRHVCVEITTIVNEPDWVKTWMSNEKIEDDKSHLSWLIALWTYRDQEVRAAALGVSVALAETEAGLSVFEPLLEIWSTAATITFDATDCCLARQQSASLMSNLVKHVYLSGNDSVECKATLGNMLGVLENANFFQELCHALSNDLYLSDILDLSGLHSHIQDLDTESVSTTVYPTIAMPRLLANIVETVIIMSSILPVPLMSNLHQAGLISHVLNVFSNELVIESLKDSSPSGACVREDVIALCTQLLSLLRICSINSDHLRKKILHDSQAFTDILALVSVCSTGDSLMPESIQSMWCELFSLMSAQLYQDGVSVQMRITPILQSNWNSVISASLQILGSDIEMDRASVLEVWNAIFSCHLRSQSGIDGQKISLNLDDSPGLSGSFGAKFCQKMLPLYDSLLMRNDDSECVQERLLVINTVKSLLAVSQSAQLTALSAGLVESLMTHANYFHQKLNMLSTQKISPTGEASVFIAEIITSIEISTNMMTDCAEVKVAFSDAGFANLMHRLWFWCELDAQLMDAILCAMTTYTSNSVLACRHLVCTSALSCPDTSTDRLQTTSNSLAHIIVKMTVNQMISMHPNLDILQRLTSLMCNFSLAPDTLAVVCKSTLHQVFSTSIQCRTRKSRTQSTLTRLWLILFLNLSFCAEGQKVILAIKDILNILTEYLNRTDSHIKELSLMILYNLTVNNRSRLLANDGLAQSAINALENGDSANELEIASSLVYALVHDSMKGKALMKKLGATDRLIEVGSACAKKSNMSKLDKQFTLTRIKKIIACTRD